MAILSKTMMSAVIKEHADRHGLRAFFTDIGGSVVGGKDAIGSIPGVCRRREYAMHESMNAGKPQKFEPVPGITAWMIGLENRRMLHGGVVGGEIVVRKGGSQAVRAYLSEQGMRLERLNAYLSAVPVMDEAAAAGAADALMETVYRVTQWRPEQMNENRLRGIQQVQLNEAIESQRRQGQPALYAFEKERRLLAGIRAGERNEARRILNEMLGAIYLSSPGLTVLRARTIELVSCLTRAAIEDNPLLESLIERNHAWTERLLGASGFEELSRVLMQALDDFIDAIYVHGVNRTNTKVRKAMDILQARFAESVSLRAVASEVGLSSCRLAHLVKEHTGRTVLQILDQVRIRQAQHLLDRTDKSCAEIAYEVGFCDQSYFTRHFRRLTGTTPARYRRAGATTGTISTRRM